MSQIKREIIIEALDALGAAAFAHPSAYDPLGNRCAAAETALRAALDAQESEKSSDGGTTP